MEGAALRALGARTPLYNLREAGRRRGPGVQATAAHAQPPARLTQLQTRRPHSSMRPCASPASTSTSRGPANLGGAVEASHPTLTQAAPTRKPQACTCCGPSLKAAASLQARPQALLPLERGCAALPGNTAACSGARTKGQCTGPAQQAPLTQGLPWPGRDPGSAPTDSIQTDSRGPACCRGSLGLQGSGGQVRSGLECQAKDTTHRQ